MPRVFSQVVLVLHELHFIVLTCITHLELPTNHFMGATCIYHTHGGVIQVRQFLATLVHRYLNLQCTMVTLRLTLWQDFGLIFDSTIVWHSSKVMVLT